MLDRQRVAILGTGAMGARIASNLLAEGYDVTVFNRSFERARPLVARGARLGLRPCDAADGAGVIIALVRDDAASENVWLGEWGALRAIGPHAVAIESSTLGTGWVVRLASHVRSRRRVPRRPGRWLAAAGGSEGADRARRR